MRSAFNGNFVLQCFDHSSAIKILNVTMFDFYLGRAYIHWKQVDSNGVSWISRSICTFSQVSPVHFAAANGKLDDVKSLVATDVKIVESKDEKQVRTPLDSW